MENNQDQNTSPEPSVQPDKQDSFEGRVREVRKKSGRGLKVLCALLSLAVIALGGHLIYDKINTKQRQTADLQASIEQAGDSADIKYYQTDEQLLYDLFAKYAPDGICGSGLEKSEQLAGEDSVIFANKTIKLKDLSQAQISQMIFWNLALDESKMQKYKDTDHFYFSQSDLEAARDELFGKNFDFNVSDMAETSTDFSWDSDMKVLHFPAGWGGTCPVEGETVRIVQAYQQNNTITVLLRRFGYDQDANRLYKYVDGKATKFSQEGRLSQDASYNIVDGGEGFYTLTAAEWRQANLYQVIFKKESGTKNYIFQSSKIIE